MVVGPVPGVCFISQEILNGDFCFGVVESVHALASFVSSSESATVHDA